MWIQKDERKTLLKYYNSLQNTQEYVRFIALPKRTYISTRNLINRGLLNEIFEDGPEHIEFMEAKEDKNPINLTNFLASSEVDIECVEITLCLTLDGYDLASKYDSWWYKTGGMWWAEYKGHWFWSVVASIITFIVGFLVGKLT